MDASQDQTDVQSFEYLEPVADGFRNYGKRQFTVRTEQFLVDKAHLLTLSAPEMTVLVGGLRVLNANDGQSAHGVFTKRPGQLTNDFFVNLLDMSTEWKPTVRRRRPIRRPRPRHRRHQVDRHRESISSSAPIPACAPWPRSTPAPTPPKKFVHDFVAAWDKVMNLDRFDLA